MDPQGSSGGPEGRGDPRPRPHPDPPHPEPPDGGGNRFCGCLYACLSFLSCCCCSRDRPPRK